MSIEVELLSNSPNIGLYEPKFNSIISNDCVMRVDIAIYHNLFVGYFNVKNQFLWKRTSRCE